jgi:TRAP-type C4-dicarboxylate transport system substrate-binding protein
MADFKGLKLRAPTRQTNKFIALLGATPVSDAGAAGGRRACPRG